MVHTREPEESKKNIIEAAEEEFAEKGFYGARVDEIANRANINKRMLYAYYGNKEELYKQVLFRVYSRMENVERELISGNYEGEELIRQIISAYFDFLHQDSNFVRILMWENLNGGKQLNTLESTRIERQTIRYFTQEIQRMIEEGIFRKEVDAKQTVISLITTCFANFSNQYTLSKLFHTDLTDNEMVELRKKHTIEMVLQYLCKK